MSVLELYTWLIVGWIPDANGAYQVRFLKFTIIRAYKSHSTCKEYD